MKQCIREASIQIAKTASLKMHQTNKIEARGYRVATPVVIPWSGSAIGMDERSEQTHKKRRFTYVSVTELEIDTAQATTTPAACQSHPLDYFLGLFYFSCISLLNGMKMEGYLVFTESPRYSS
jgi:hypothetical protein